MNGRAIIATMLCRYNFIDLLKIMYFLITYVNHFLCNIISSIQILPKSLIPVNFCSKLVRIDYNLSLMFMYKILSVILRCVHTGNNSWMYDFRF